jgi:hypothetical protein
MFTGYVFCARSIVLFGMKWIKWGSMQGLLWSVAVHTVLPGCQQVLGRETKFQSVPKVSCNCRGGH